MMRPCTQNPKLSTHEAMEGMFSFDSTPMAPIGTECMVHVKPSQRQTWELPSIKAWYVAPALSAITTGSKSLLITETGAVRTTDTFKFLHHTLPVPAITPTDRILQATKHLKKAIKNHTTPAPDKLEAIAALNALITGTTPDPPLPEPATKAPRHDIIDTVKHYEDEPVSLPLHNTPTPSPLPTTHCPMAIPFDDDELNDAPGISAADIMPPSCYNLRSHAQHIIQSALNYGLIIPQDHITFVDIDETTGKSLEYQDLIKMDAHKDTWSTNYANELGQLTQGIRDISGTNTMFFIHKCEVPKDHQKGITYGRIVVVLTPQKKEQAQTRLTVGDNLIDYPWEVATPTSDLTTAKLLFNSVISTPGKFLWSWTSIFFILTPPMERPEFMHLQLNPIPGEIIEKYNLRKKADNKGWV
eukprot:CCRYP_016888-RA/>CCRYP_016888-RA protein AED:0.40 eAED:0.36 QI:0/-1/0/1/-1/1/1/0/413